MTRFAVTVVVVFILSAAPATAQRWTFEFPSLTFPPEPVAPRDGMSSTAPTATGNG